MRYFITVLKNLKKIILCLLILSFLSAYDCKIEIITVKSMLPREEHIDVGFYYSLLSEFGQDDISEINWENLSKLSQNPNSNIFSMFMLLDSEDQKIRLLEMFMSYECEFYTTTFDDFLSDPVNKKNFSLAKNKLTQILFCAGFSYEYTEAFFRKYFTFDRINLKFLYILKSFKYTSKNFEESETIPLFKIISRNQHLIDWINQKILEFEKI